jgi:hypothetical protein
MRKLSCIGCFLAAATAATLFEPRALAQDSATKPTGTDPGAQNDGSGTAGTVSVTTTVPLAPVATSNDSVTNVLENKGQGYYFLGLNYRVNLVPAFIINLFVDQGPNLVATSTAGLSFDYRKDHFSIIAGANFSEYGFDPVLFLQKGKDPSDPGDWGLVHSTLKAVYVTVDLLWSVPLVRTGQADFEFGFSVGLGGVFGNLYNTWVSDNPAAGGPAYTSQSGQPWYLCSQVTSAQSLAGGAPNGCNASNHQNATIAKVGNGSNTGYREPNWFDSPGGSVPTVFPWLSLPILGFRFKPIKELEMRLNGGFSITGFFFNFAAYYGFENPKSTPH